MAPANLAFAAIVIAYPIIIYFGLDFFETRLVAVVIILVALARYSLIKRMKGVAARMPRTNFVIAALLIVGVSAMAANSPVLLLYYPVCMNVLLFGLFMASLFRPPSMIEQFARIQRPNLPDAAVAYTRKVTMVWCGFFAVNGSIALYTILNTNIAFWAIYNSLVSYSLMGLLFAGEYVVRKFVKRSVERRQGAKGQF